MKLSVTLDEELINRAKMISKISDTPSLLRRAIEYIVAYESAEREYKRTGNFEDLSRTLRRLYDGEEL